MEELIHLYASSDCQNAAEPTVTARRPRNNISNGVLSGPKTVNSMSSVTKRPAMKSITGIVLLKTVSSSASSAISTTTRLEGRTGFHVVIAWNGTITMNPADVASWQPLSQAQITSTTEVLYTLLEEYKFRCRCYLSS